MAASSGSITSAGFRTVPTKGGFWLNVTALGSVSFAVEYYAASGAGYQQRGEVQLALTGGNEVRVYVKLGFDPVVAAITSAKWGSADAALLFSDTGSVISAKL